MMSSFWNIMSEFLSTVSRKKAHWYRVFDPADIELSYEKIQSTFPCLATLTMMEDCHMKQLLLHLGLAKTRNDCVYADRQAWDNFIAREELSNVETPFFEIDRRRHVYLRIGVWTVKHKCRTPAAIWGFQNKYLPSSKALHLISCIEDTSEDNDSSEDGDDDDDDEDEEDDE